VVDDVEPRSPQDADPAWGGSDELDASGQIDGSTPVQAFEFEPRTLEAFGDREAAIDGAREAHER
jgi:hypothetical protein